MNFKNLWQHPKTTIAGLLLGVVQVGTILTQGGLTGPSIGNTTWLGLAVAMATLLLGAVAKDPSSTPSSPGSTAKLGAWMLIAVLTMGSMPMLTGCTQAQKISVAQEIVNWAPSITSAVNTIAATISIMEPGAALVTATATAGFDTLSAAFQAAAKDYLANPNQTTLALLQGEIVKFQQSVNASLLQVAGIKDANSQKTALMAINALATAVNTILALVQSVSSKAQIAAMARGIAIPLSTVRAQMDEAALASASQRVTRDIGLPAAAAPTPGQFFAYEAQQGF